MLFERFLKKRQQAAETAEQAVRTKRQETWAALARDHTDAAVRRDAVGQLLDLPELHRILNEDADAGVREAASVRYLHLLSDTTPSAVPLETLLSEVSCLSDTALLDQIALLAAAPEIRRLAISRSDTPAILATCAVQDPLAANRGLAIERLEDKQGLEQVLRQIGKRDKNVYRVAREKLRLIAEREELPRRVRDQCEELCAKAERLGRLENWSQDRALLEYLDQQWAAIESLAEPDWRSRYQVQRERFLAAYANYCRENAAQIAAQESQARLRDQRQALLEELAAAPRFTEESELRALRARVAAAWSDLARLPDAQQRPLDTRYGTLDQAAETAQRGLAEQRRHRDQLQRICTKVELLLAESRALDHRQTKALIDQGRTHAAECPGDGAQQFLTLAERLESRLRHQRKHAEQRLQQFPERLAELEVHLEAGELKKADPLYQSLQAGLDLIQASGLSREAETDLSGRLRALAPRLRDLQRWRRWGTDQHREGLCVDMEALIEKDLPLEAIADQFHTLQLDWKGLAKSGSPTNQALWERFHTAAERVYERCRPYLSAQAAEREANRLARENVCQQIEEFLSKVDWERVDWKRILRAEREIRRTWEAIGPTEGRHRKRLERRFHQSIRQLDQRLDAERKRNQALKHRLIERAQALVELPDLDSAIETTKALQREWRTSVPARQKDENRLWQEFRAACDAVFERRAMQHQAHTNELKDNLATRTAICTEALAFLAATEDPRQLTAGWRDLEERWRDAQALPIPRQASGRLTQQWQECRDRFAQHQRACEERQRQGMLDLLRRQADLCEELELGLLTGSPDTLDLEDARQRWRQLPIQPDGTLQQALQGRFEFAVEAVGDPERLQALRQRYAGNGEHRRRLCLQLEILAGVPSPTEFGKQRLELQVARLAEHMVEGEDDPLQDTAQLLRDWYLCGPAPRDEGLDVRFARICEAIGTTPTPAVAAAVH